VAAVIVPSGFAKSQLKGRIGNVAVIPLGVSLPATSYTPPSTPYFLVVGRVDKKKNLKVIIDAFGMMKVRRFGRTPTAVGDQSSGNQAKLFFAGKFGFGAEEIIKNAQRSGAIKDIEFMGAVSDQELSALYRGAQALLHPCPVEGFGLPVIEAMSQGLAVIVSNVGAAAEAAGEAAIKVDPHDPEVWVRAMEQSFDPGVRNSLVEQGRMRAAEFTWQSAALNTWQILMK